MRKFDSTTADSYSVADVEVTRWEQYDLGDALPFNAMWYVVPPGSSSPVDNHPERELSLVVSGRGLVQSGDDRFEVGPGNAFLLDCDEDHMVTNRSSEPLVVFSTYWMAADEVPAELERQASHV